MVELAKQSFLLLNNPGVYLSGLLVLLLLFWSAFSLFELIFNKNILLILGPKIYVQRNTALKCCNVLLKFLVLLKIR